MTQSLMRFLTPNTSGSASWWKISALWRLQKQLFSGGKRVYDSPPLAEIKDYCARQVATLWDEVTRFENPHRYYVDLSQRLWEEKQRLLSEHSF